MTNTKPYINIKSLSYFPNEEEVLIMLGAIFKIEQVEYNEHEQTWIGTLSLCSVDEYELKQLMKQMKEEVDEGMGSLGWLLYNQGEYEKATNYFQQLILEPTIDNFDRSQCYRGLGAIQIALKNYDEALENFKNELDLLTEHDDQEYNATTYAKIGEIYFFKKDLNSALSYEQKALDILLPLNTSELSDVYRTMGHIYYEKALDIDHQYLPENHYNFGITHESIGSSYHNSGNDQKAVEHFAKAREVYLKCLPPTHSRILSLEKSINQAQAKLNNN